MKKVIILIILTVVVIFGIYYFFIKKVNCIQVVVSATNRITGKTKVFGNPCGIPFWYKDIKAWNQ